MSKAKYALVYLIATLDFAQRSVHAKLVSQATDKTMTTKDFRIGNYVLFAEDSTVFEVQEIDEFGLEVKNEEEETWIEIDSFQGIDIDEDWLRKLRFLKSSITFDKRPVYEIGFNSKHYKVQEVGDIYKHWYIFHSEGLITSNIRFVHQLQNIYFALTSEELICIE